MCDYRLALLIQAYPAAASESQPDYSFWLFASMMIYYKIPLKQYISIFEVMDKISRLKKISQIALNYSNKHEGPKGFVKVVQVGPRDGLQNEKKIIQLNKKFDLITKLSKTGLKAIQVGSFVSPKWVPQMANTKQLYEKIDKVEGISYPCLVPNQMGMGAAIKTGVKQIAVFASATESFSKKNLNCTIQQSLNKFVPVAKMAKEHNIKMRGYVSMVMGCPYEGQVQPQKVADVTEKLFQLGCYEVSLGDTVGKGSPDKVRNLFKSLNHFPIENLAVHFHDTFDNAIENIFAALQFGCRTVDSSIGGLGGCPYSMKPVGNVCTQNVAYSLGRAGFETGLSLQGLKETGNWICGELQRGNLCVY